MKITSLSQIKEKNLTKLYATNDSGGIDVFEVDADMLYHNGNIFDYADNIDEILTTYYYPFYSTKKEACNE